MTTPTPLATIAVLPDPRRRATTPRNAPNHRRVARRLGVVVWAGSLLAAGCGGGGGNKTAAPGPGPTLSLPAASTPNSSGGAPGAGGAVGGQTATTFTCDSFPAQELLAAVQSAAPKTTAGSVKTERLADKFGSPLVCDYRFASNLKPGLDPSTDIGQDVTFIVKLADGSVDGVPTPQVIKDGFAKERDKIKNHASGDATSDIQYLFVPVTGVGDDAYLNDYFTRLAGINEADQSNLNILRSTLPMSVEVNFQYSTQPDSSIAVPAVADDPFQNDSRHTIVTAVAKAILAKL